MTIACLSLSACFQTFQGRETFIVGHNGKDVTLSYYVESNENFDDVNWNSAKEKVKKHCQHELNYSDAERFGRPNRKCISTAYTGDAENCLEYEVSVPYKCIAKGLDLKK